jgi:hypothetical protein
MNTYLSDKPISLWKSVRLRRIINEEIISKMDVGSVQEKLEEVKRTLENWGEQRL